MFAKLFSTDYKHQHPRYSTSYNNVLHHTETTSTKDFNN